MSIYQNKKAILFDLDNTLCSTNFDFYAHMLNVFQKHLESFDRQHFQLFKFAWQDFTNDERPSNITLAFEYAFQQSKFPIKKTVLANIVKAFSEQYIQSNLLFPPLKKNLQLLSKKYKLAIVTNGPADLQMGVIENCQLQPFFHTIVISGDPEVVVRKPNPLIFLRTLQLLDVTSDQALMIGDHPHKDIKGARDAGIDAELIESPEQTNLLIEKILSN
jgi:putative hydrolase of the HAD superfamily